MCYNNSIFSLSLSTILFSYSVYAFQFDLDFQQGRFEASIQHWQAILNQTTDKSKQIEAKIGLAFAYQKLGFYKKSVNLLNQANSQLNEIPNELDEFWIYMGFSDYLNSTDQQHTKNLNFLERAEALAKRLDQPYLLAEVLKRKGNSLVLLHKTEEVKNIYQNSLKLAQQIGNNHLATEILVNLAQFSKEADDFKKAIQAIQQLEPSFIKSFGFIKLSNLAENVFNLPKEQQDRQYYREKSLHYAIESATKTQDWRNLSYAHGLLGEFYATEGQNDEFSLQEFRQALFFAQQGNLITSLFEIKKCRERTKALSLPELTYRWYWQLGRLLRKQQKIDDARTAYDNAIQQLRFIHHTLSNKNNIDFDKDVIPVYLDLADLLVEKALDISDHEKQQQFLKESRQVLEQLAEHELRDYLQIDYCEALYPKVKEDTCELKEEVKIKKGTAVLYSILRSAESLKFLLQVDNDFYPILVPKEITGKIESFHEKCANKDKGECQSLGKNLYLYFIEPLEAKLQDHDIKEMIIVPNGDLKEIPFSALFDEKDSKYLVEKYKLSYAQGVNTINPNAREKDKPQKIFLGGISKQIPGFEKEFVPLLEAKKELESIKELVVSSEEILLDEKFTKVSLSAALKKHYQWIHLATHAQFGDSPKDTFLLVYGEKLFLADFQDLLEQKEKQYPELITLSACQTATGDGRVFLGLAGTAVKSGAKSALGSLWKVNDTATNELMQNFYKALKNEEPSKSAALQWAQTQFLHDSDDEHKHPYYWAPFILIGNSQ